MAGDHDATSVGTRTQDAQCRTVFGKGGRVSEVITSTSTKTVEKDAVYKTSRTTLPMGTVTKDVTTVIAVETVFITKTVPGDKIVSTITDAVEATETSTKHEVETSTSWVIVDRAAHNKRDQVPVSVKCKQVEVIQTTYIDITTAKRSMTTVAGSTVSVTKTVRDVTTETAAGVTHYETSYTTTA